jgi:hypothetical protein
VSQDDDWFFITLSFASLLSVIEAVEGKEFEVLVKSASPLVQPTKVRVFTDGYCADRLSWCTEGEDQEHTFYGYKSNIVK